MVAALRQGSALCGACLGCDAFAVLCRLKDCRLEPV